MTENVMIQIVELPDKYFETFGYLALNGSFCKLLQVMKGSSKILPKFYQAQINFRSFSMTKSKMLIKTCLKLAN